MSTLSGRIRVVKNNSYIAVCMGIGLLILLGILGNYSQAQGVMEISSQGTQVVIASTSASQSAEIPVPVEKETKTFQIKYTSVADVQTMAQSLLSPASVSSPAGKITSDPRTNLLIVIDTPTVIKKIEALIESVDIPLETAIIPVKFADVQDVAREIISINPRLKINVDTRTSNLIITDIPSKIDQVKSLVAQMESTYTNKPQTGLDCSIVKVVLDDKHNTGIDWSKCPFIGKSGISSAILLENMDYEKLLDWLKNFGSADLLSRKRVTVVLNEETRVRDGIRYQTTEKPSVSTDTLGGTVYKGTPQVEDYGFTYRFLAKPMDAKSEESALIVTFGVDGVLPQSGSTVAYGLNVNNAQIPDGMTLITEDVRAIPRADEGNPKKIQYQSVDLILLITPHSFKPVTQETTITK